MSTEQENADALAVFRAFEEKHHSLQEARAANIDHADEMRRLVLKMHPETISVEGYRSIRNSLVTYLEMLRVQIEETVSVADTRYAEMRSWYEYAGLLPQTAEQPGEQSPHGAGMEAGQSSKE